MEPGEWQQIAHWLQAADVDCIEITRPGQRVRLLRGPGGYGIDSASSEPATMAAVAPPVNRNRETVFATAHTAGIFLTAHPLRPSPLARHGDSVDKGDVVGLLQIGQVLAGVTAPVAGVVTATLLTSRTLAGYGTPLVEIDAGAR